MAKVLNSISFDLPSAPVSAAVNDTFTFAGTPSFTGSGGVQRYDWKWEVNDGGGFVTIAASGTGLITAGTNPLVNENSQTQNSITVTCDAIGSYTIRMAGAPSTGGSYTVLSSTQTVEVAANNVVVTPDTASLTTSLFAPTVTASDHKTVTPGVAALVTEAFAPAVSVSDNKLVTPGTLALSTATFAPTVTATQNQKVTPDTATLTLTTFAPSVTSGGGVTVTPGTASLTTATFAPVVTATQNQVVTPSTASLSLATFPPSVTATANQIVVPGVLALSIATFAPTVTASSDSAGGFASRIAGGVNVGDIKLGDTFDFKFTTIDSTGLPSALTGGAVAAYPGNSVTELTAGITLTADLDSLVGLNNIRVVATSANGYAAGTNYSLVLTAGTVNGVSVTGYVVAYFTIEATTMAEILNAKFILQRKRVLDPATGLFTIYAADGVTPLFTAMTYKDADGTQPYDGSGRIHRTEELS